ncbi:MAG TPA: hypothetical protein DIW52_13165 [Pseudomonas sp.]|jgi:hypothetical protein|nr:hypothetical protein [Pseudomonas sp.]
MNTDDIALPARQMESIKLENLLINFTTEFQRIWDSRGSDSKPGSFWRPTPAPDLLPGYFPLGDVVGPGFDNINQNSIVAVVCEGDPQIQDASKGKALSPPDDFEQVWRDSGSGAKSDLTIWRPIPPHGYVALGMVCSNGRDKPLLNTVRCVRSDLVVASPISRMIWSDEGSGAKEKFSAWAIQPPTAAAGEIYFSSGTFIATRSYKRPTTNVVAYSLRMQIPLRADPPLVPPALSGYELPESDETAKSTQIARLPWFTILDPGLSPLEQLRTSAFYRLERVDQYVRIGHGHNKSTVGQNFKWTASRAQRVETLEAFSDLTSIKIRTDWPFNVTNLQTLSWLLSSPVQFSARLSKDFTHTEISSISWSASAAVEIITIVPKHKFVAVYQIQSDYRLLREDGTQVAIDISYTDTDSLYLTEYPIESDCEVTDTSLPLADSSTATDTAP